MNLSAKESIPFVVKRVKGEHTDSCQHCLVKVMKLSLVVILLTRYIKAQMRVRV